MPQKPRASLFPLAPLKSQRQRGGAQGEQAKRPRPLNLPKNATATALVVIPSRHQDSVRRAEAIHETDA